MSRVLVLYPKELLSQSKFQRKVGKVISRLEDVCLLYMNDHNGYVEQYAIESEGSVNAEPLLAIQGADLTHAIVFDDGEEFNEESALLKEMDIPTRLLKIVITRVINIKRETQYEGLKSTPDYEYIGRGSYWGNPYSMFESNDDGEMDDREEVIRKYKYDFDFDLFPNKEKSELIKLKGKRLGCFCSPAACHGDVLADYLNALDEE
ncbi:hypothetical protein GPB2148_1519 [marine gamma proteobacterium HTCC2148]|nr:hypothetical protein GPB2148_1519 [marine gamma proteobacterium HTCC2148]